MGLRQVEMAKFFVKSWGCSTNFADGETIAGLLAANGLEITDAWEKSDIVVANSCTVVGPSEAHFWSFVKAALEAQKPVLLAGCVVQADSARSNPLPAWTKEYASQIAVIGTKRLTEAPVMVARLLSGDCVDGIAVDLEVGQVTPLGLPKVRKNPLVEIVPVASGCRGACTYCKTRMARGQLTSVPVPDLVDDVVARLPFVEAWLTGQDTGAYGLDIETTLPALMAALTPRIPPATRIRIGMTNPDGVMPRLPEWIKMMADARVYKFLHLPIQSGSDAVLRRMNRRYTVSDFRTVVSTLQAGVPGLTVMTDIIVGFPGETDEDWAATMAVVRDLEVHFINITRFYPRPGTPAAKMKPVDSKTVKARTREISAWNATRRGLLDGLVGRTVTVTVTDRAHRGTMMVGHTDSYIQVLLPLDDDILARGGAVRAEIVSAGAWSVEGRIVPHHVGQE